MPGENAFEVEGSIVAALPNGTYRVELANGHRLLGFVPGLARRTHRPRRPGERVLVRLSPADLSVGRLMVET